MKEFLSYFTGNMDPAEFAALCCFALIGAVIKLTMHVNSRDVNSPDTPVKFSLTFLLADNWKRILNSALLVYLFIRFPAQLIPANIYQLISGGGQFLLAAIIGFCFDSLSEYLKDKVSFLQVNRANIYQPEPGPAAQEIPK
jgi:hypothetical protein